MPFRIVGTGLSNQCHNHDLHHADRHMDQTVRADSFSSSRWISDEGPQADTSLALTAAPYFALNANEAETILDEVSAALIGWEDTAAKLGMSRADIAVYAAVIYSPPP